MNTPLVSICCITYNHAPFIRQCLEGFLMQKGVVYEILIHDDCSTDGTTEIVKEYAAKYPDLIFPLYETENQYSKPNRQPIDFYNYRRAKGKYIAYCEGDDYWTDPLKLQKQVDFMEANPEYSVCFHEYYSYDTKNNKYYSSTYPFEGDFDVTPEIFLYGNINCAQPLTMMFRMSCFSFEWSKHYHKYFDTIENYHLLCVGKGRFLRFNGGQYNWQPTGVSSQMQSCERAKLTLATYVSMYRYTKDYLLKKKVLDSALWALKVYDEDNCIKEQKFVWRELCKIPLIMAKVYIIRCKHFLKRKLRKKS